MPATFRFKTSSIASRDLGDLIAIRNEPGHDYGIIVGHISDESAFIVAVLRPADPAQAPHMKLVPDRVDCACYGKNWLVELSDDLSDNQEAEEAGYAFVADDSCYLKFDGDPAAPDVLKPVTVNLETVKVHSPRGRRMVASGWRLWISPEDRNDPFTEPLIEYSSEE